MTRSIKLLDFWRQGLALGQALKFPPQAQTLLRARIAFPDVYFISVAAPARPFDLTLIFLLPHVSWFERIKPSRSRGALDTVQSDGDFAKLEKSPPLWILDAPTTMLIDTFGRTHNNLRISVTDRCNLRCTYCMPEEEVFMDRAALLTFEEITHFVRVAAPLGIDKLRLTGGEPLLRRDLPRLVRMVAAVPGIKDVGLTTNGLLLTHQAQALFDAGLRRLNISLDTLDPGRFREISRREGLEQVLAGIAAAKKAGFAPIKINAVSIRGLTEPDVAPLARFAREHGLEMRFIEYMPIGAEAWERSKVYFAHEILEQIEREVAPLVPADDYDPRAPAMDFQYSDGGGRVGIIASVSRPFCMSCNRLRLTSDGKLRNCLFALNEVDVKPLLRGAPDDIRLAEMIRQNVHEKWEGHEINTARFIKPQRTMHAIGG